VGRHSEPADATVTEPAQWRPERRSRWPLTLGAALLVLVGMAAGGAVVTVTGISADERVEVVPSPSPSPVTPSPVTGLGRTQLSVAPACVHALDQVQSVYQELQGIGNAASQLDIAALDRFVRQLQKLRPSLQDNLAGCHATVHLPPATPQPTVTSTPSP
jgi:hypothetical protein